jgi:hypothetical protein
MIHTRFLDLHVIYDFILQRYGPFFITIALILEQLQIYVRKQI